MARRVVVTGIGLLSPLGNTPDSFFDRAVSGRSAIHSIRKFDASDFPVRIAAELDLTGEDQIADSVRSEMPPAAQWSVLAARKAVRDAAIVLPDIDPFSLSVVVGVSVSSLQGIDEGHFAQRCQGMKDLPASAVVLANPASAASQISRDLGLFGEAVNVTTACSSSTSALGYAARLIRHGEYDWVIAGGADEGVTPLWIGALGNGKHLSRRNNDPKSASRPFDRERDGYVLSDAACMLVLEDYEHACARNAEIYCELSGFGATSDACSAFKLNKSEEPGAHALESALRVAQKIPSDIDYYCALGVSMPFLDIRETRMIKRVFRESAARLPISSIKSVMGHPLGTAGVMQAATCIMSIKRGAIPPTANYEWPDPECDLDYVPNEARACRVRNAMLYTLGNGGSNSALVFSAC